MSRTIDGSQLRKAFVTAGEVLQAQREQVDALNVFPVPDGDTGTNMALTWQGAVAELARVREDTIPAVAQAMARGSLMGARGNSGVILSQILRGFALKLNQVQEMGPKEVAAAFRGAADTAYKGVLKPVEGTILTVIREAAQGAEKAVRKASSAIEVWQAAVVAAEEGLQRTPELLPILRQVGVVDAGGQGLVILLRAMLASFQDQDVQWVLTKPAQAQATPQMVEVVDELPADLGDIKYHYCTEFILKGQDLPLALLRGKLDPLGDSLLVVGEADLAKIHVHTNHPGQALEIAVQYGSLHNIKISNMLDQYLEKQQQEASKPAAAPVKEEKELGLVAVATGAGLTRVFTSLGVDQVVAGGQTNNPSTADLLAAVEAVPARTVLILPNNGNVIMAAEQVGQLTSKQVVVIPSRTIPQGLAALMQFDPGADLAANVEAMTAALGQVVSGEITYAVRDSQIDGLAIKAGDILGLIDDKVQVVGKTREEVFLNMLAHIVTEDHSLLTFFAGEGVGPEEQQEMLTRLQAAYPQLEIELHQGDQPVYAYVFGVE
ncbi:hypothetical protein CTH_1802 [Carboxydocella thermautotrophica]|nr:hypothetical protein CTH_1802 [Carboxydocella thermautotrophica]